MKQCIEELQLSYPKRQISTIDFIKLLIENNKIQKEEIFKLKSSGILESLKRESQEKIENKGSLIQCLNYKLRKKANMGKNN